MMKKALGFVLLMCLSLPLAADRKLYRYGWENVDDPSAPLLGEYRNGDVIESVNTTTVRTGSQSLKLIDNDNYDYTYGEQAYICFIQGLQEGDIVQGSFWRYNESPNAGCRISANYNDAAAGFKGYFTDGDVANAGVGNTGIWEKTSYSWVYTQAGDTTRTAMMILARPYNNKNDVCYVDDLEVIVPAHVTNVVFPGTYDYYELIVDDPNAVQERSYGWEDGYADVLGVFGTAYEPTNTSTPDPVHSGEHALKVAEFPQDGTPEAQIAFVTGLQDGDIVKAGFWAYDLTPASSPSLRIWGNWADSDDITSFFGSAGGNEDYSGASAWTRLEHQWVFSSGDGSADALMIVARLYSPASDVEYQDYYIDDVNVIAPDHATIIFPGDLFKAEDYAQSTYSWGNFNGPATEQNVLLGTFGMVNAELELFESYNGDNKALLLTDATEAYTMSTLKQAMNRGYSVDLNGPVTPEGYLAVVKGLADGQRVKAAVQAKSNSPSESAGVRLWAHYIYDENDLNSFAGSAGGFNGYSDADDWTKLSYPWTFKATPYVDASGIERIPTAMVISARAYSQYGEGGVIDELTVEAPMAAAVEFPSPAGEGICVGGLPEFDFNLDCRVNLLDLAEFAAGWLTCSLQPDASCN